MVKEISTDTFVTMQNYQLSDNSDNAIIKPTENNTILCLQTHFVYFKTIPGVLKIVELALGILCYCLAPPYYYSGAQWFSYVILVIFIGTLIWVIIYFLRIKDALKQPYDRTLLAIEMVVTGIFTVYYLHASLVQIYVHPSGGSTDAGIIAFLNTLVYGFGTYLLYQEVKPNINIQTIQN